MMATAFCSTVVEIAPGVKLTIDGNSKITAGNGSFAAPRPNALSLSAPATCPGSTAACREACYVHGLRRYAPDVAAAYDANTAALREVLDGAASRRASTACALGGWITRHCRGGFRWHVSGDVFSATHAQWIADVCWSSPGVWHWIYTRSFGLVEGLVGVPNLVVNVSADADGYLAARVTADDHGLRLCYLVREGAPVPHDLRLGDVLFPDYPLRGRDKRSAWWDTLSPQQRGHVCPADMWGQSEARRCTVPGADGRGCTRCTVANWEVRA